MSDNWPKKYNINYFGYAVNLEFKFKLDFDQERESKIKKKSKFLFKKLSWFNKLSKLK